MDKREVSYKIGTPEYNGHDLLLEEYSDKRAITKEQIEEYHRQLAVEEQRAREACLRALIALADEHGYDIGAAPELMPDGRIVAAWGIQRKAQKPA